MTAHEQSIPSICDQLGQPDVKSFLSRCTLEEAPRIITLHQAGLELYGDDALPALLSFANQSTFPHLNGIFGRQEVEPTRAAVRIFFAQLERPGTRRSISLLTGAQMRTASAGQVLHPTATL